MYPGTKQIASFMSASLKLSPRCASGVTAYSRPQVALCLLNVRFPAKRSNLFDVRSSSRYGTNKLHCVDLGVTVFRFLPVNLVEEGRRPCIRTKDGEWIRS